MNMEQRQPVDDDVIRGPGPGLGERVQVRGDRAARKHRALGPAGGPGRVDDQRRDPRRLRRCSRWLRATRERSTARRRGAQSSAGSDAPGSTDQDVWAAVGEDMLELGAAELGLIGTSGIPAQTAATAATQNSSDGSAQTATRSVPARFAAKPQPPRATHRMRGPCRRRRRPAAPSSRYESGQHERRLAVSCD